MKPEVKKLILSNLPYLIFVYLFGKLGQAYRLAAGVDLSEKLLHFMDGCSAAFANAAPSFHPFDLLIGVAGAAALRLMVYCKSKNAKKYRKGEEYGSARWRAARAMGYRKIVTYILDTESGASLRAAGWKCAGLAGGKRWTGSRRPAADLYPAQMKYRYEQSIDERSF